VLCQCHCTNKLWYIERASRMMGGYRLTAVGAPCRGGQRGSAFAYPALGASMVSAQATCGGIGLVVGTETSSASAGGCCLATPPSEKQYGGWSKDGLLGLCVQSATRRQAPPVGLASVAHACHHSIATCLAPLGRRARDPTRRFVHTSRDRQQDSYNPLRFDALEAIQRGHPVEDLDRDSGSSCRLPLLMETQVGCHILA